jgi:hypothetical protein
MFPNEVVVVSLISSLVEVSPQNTKSSKNKKETFFI